MTDARRSAAPQHTPVLRERIVELLTPALQRPGAVFVDATLGMGGHTQAVLDRLPGVTAYGVDRDRDALEHATHRLARFGSRFRPVHAVYDEAFESVARQGHPEVDAVLFDLGVSSWQLDETTRGFAYRTDAPLDMRMDQSVGRTAADVLNEYSVSDLERILKDYGEERYARRIARAIVRARETQPWRTSGPLVEMLREVIPAASQRTSGHPAKRTFQALRIEVNGELDSWRAALPAAIEHLRLDGRIAVLSYHSLEDRIAKRVLAAGATSSAPPGMPVERPDQAPYLKLLVRGGQTPSAQEIEDNPRAASARLRAAVRVRSTKGSTP